MTELVFRDDAYAKECQAIVCGVNDRGGILLDRTVFYPTGGGQPGDSGLLILETGQEIAIATAVKGDNADEVVHVPDENQSLPDVGARVTARIDWDRRYKLMRMHTALHVMSSVLPYPVTGGQINEDYGRLDFDLGAHATPDKDELTKQINTVISAGKPVQSDWITDEELDANPGLVKTMSVQPPKGQGRVRLVHIEGVDLQPCGGTHVANIDEIGCIKVEKIQSKGKQNKRMRIVFD